MIDLKRLGIYLMPWYGHVVTELGDGHDGREKLYVII